MQDKAEAKLRKVQERADAERKLKAEKSKEWHKQQHEREQRRVQVGRSTSAFSPVIFQFSSCIRA